MILTAMGAALVVLGLAIGWYGLRPVPTAVRLLVTTVREPGTAASADAGTFLACRGVAREREDGGTVRGPFTGRPCLGVEYEVTERQLFAVGLPPWGDLHLDDGVAVRSFDLVGEGRVRVDPSTRRFSPDVAGETTVVESDRRPPERVRTFLDRRGVPATPGLMGRVPGMGRRRYVERRIDAGERYLVAGSVDGEGALSGTVLVSDGTATGTARRRLVHALGPTLVALVLVAAGLAALLV